MTEKTHHINKPMNYLIQAWSAVYMLALMWQRISEGEYEKAMTAQFLFLDHHDNAQAIMDAMTPDENETLELMHQIALEGK